MESMEINLAVDLNIARTFTPHPEHFQAFSLVLKWIRLGFFGHKSTHGAPPTAEQQTNKFYGMF